MIDTRIQIGDGPLWDFFSKWGFIYMDADERTEAPAKARAVSSYAEEPGEHTDPRTVQGAFDYTAKFLVEAPNRNMKNANSKIAAFNKALYTMDAGSGIRRYKTVTFYNDHNRVKIVGLPEPIAEPTSFYRRDDGSVMDCVEVELKIRVSNPALCDFDLFLTKEAPYGPTHSTAEVSMNVSITTDGKKIFVRTSRPLASGEFPCLLRRGSVMNGRTATDTGRPKRQRGRHRWQPFYIYSDVHHTLNAMPAFTLGGDGAVVPTPAAAAMGADFGRICGWSVENTSRQGYPVAKIAKSKSSNFIVPALAGRSAGIRFGIGIYSLGQWNNPVRVSNIAYFRSNMSLARNGAGVAMEQWLSV